MNESMSKDTNEGNRHGVLIEQSTTQPTALLPPLCLLHLNTPHCEDARQTRKQTAHSLLRVDERLRDNRRQQQLTTATHQNKRVQNIYMSSRAGVRLKVSGAQRTRKSPHENPKSENHPSNRIGCQAEYGSFFLIPPRT